MSGTLLNNTDEALASAVNVIADRIQQLSKEDRDDFFLLLPAILGDSEEEKLSALKAAQEILVQAPVKVRQVESPEPPAQALAKWLTFISARIRSAREAAGMTQEQLAKESGLQQSHISRLEKGEHSPTSKTLSKIAMALGQPADYFNLGATE